MSMPVLKIGIAGLGTVGGGVIKLIERNGEMIAARAGARFEVVAVSARDRHRDRGIALDTFTWCDNPLELVDHADIIVELVGGSDGTALALARAALKAGKGFVTANKAMLAHHGAELARLSEAHSAPLKFEAAVAGGIPIIKAVKEGLAANRIDSVWGILNGTCNYILTTMDKTGREFADVLDEAQKLGYAEADPTFDIDGIDAAHKTAILAALAFGTEVNFAGMSVEGIRHISKIDIDYARELGYRVKLLGGAKRINGGLEQRVYPCMVPLSSPIAHVDGAYNAVTLHGDAVEKSFYQGKGAGEGPTASAVVADLIDIARAHSDAPFSVPVSDLKPSHIIAPGDHIGRFYLRLMVADAPGVIAEIAGALRDETVSVESLIQRGRSTGGGVYLVLTTHAIAERHVTAALERIAGFASTLEKPAMIRILDE